MIKTYFVDNNNEENIRLDLFIVKKNPDITRTMAQKLILDSYITVNKKKSKTGYKIVYGDNIEASFPESVLPVHILPENIPIEIIFEDEHLVIINKPAGMVVHPAPGNYNGTLVNALLYHCKNLSGINGVLRPGIVHRLDKDTSGLIVVAKNDFTHHKLQEKWAKREINRKYTALVHGIFSQIRFTVNAPIGRDFKNRHKMSVTEKNSRPAITHFYVKEKFKNHSLINAKLDTGRTHQVRVHLAFIKHPVVGDSIYGHNDDSSIISRQALHSTLLGFEHPVSNKYMEFENPLPDDMINAFEKVKKC